MNRLFLSLAALALLGAAGLRAEGPAAGAGAGRVKAGANRPYHGGYLGERRESYEKRVRAELREMKVKIARLEAKAKVMTAAARKSFEEDVRLLREKYNAAEKKLPELEAAGSAEWRRLRSDMDGAVTGLEKAYRQTAAKVESTVHKAAPKKAAGRPDHRGLRGSY